ncbi:DUF2141 domain-containing protein [Haloferula sp. BvORR071]|uniref:DUF2141 domain-containing protein n=1 Tax=Haloferula sp. BvORR071 TaxID=1396141 RepID=UPI0006961103|nr:DUF2141 domain-containing protein [Haloferula sp. BvORR071]
MLRWLLVPLLAAAPAFAGDVRLTVSKVKDNSGQVSALLFAAEDGFPDQTGKAAYQGRVVAKKGTTEILLHDVKPGRYAVSVIHDSNSNAKLDRNFIGIPTEGAGTSNSAQRGKPVYQKAVVEVKEGGSVTVELNYW